MNGLQLNRILVVDDELFIRKTIKGLLRTIGHFDMEEAGDGETALALLPTFHPDLVLCDIGMKPMGGFEFIKRLRSQEGESRQKIRIIMLTADATVSTVHAALPLKLDGYLVKPVPPRRLRELMAKNFDLPPLNEPT